MTAVGPRSPIPDVNSAAAAPSNAADVRARERQHDQELLARAAGGDAGAFREIVDRHQRRAQAVAHGVLRNAEDAREVVQEAFLRVYRHLHEFEGQASFGTWLYRIVVNLSIDQLRKRTGQQVELDDHTNLDGAPAEMLPFRGDSDPHDALSRKRLVDAMQSALDRLPPYHRAVIVLREVEGLSYEEMAKALDVSKGTIMSRLFHARRKMQAMLREALGDEVPAGDGDGDEEKPSEADDA